MVRGIVDHDIEASFLTVLALSDLGLKNIWAKATNEKHARIFERTGAHHVVFPEQRMTASIAPPSDPIDRKRLSGT